MKLEELPKQIDPWLACREAKEIHGSLKVSDLTRIPSVPYSEEKSVILRLSFLQEGEFSVIRGELTAEVPVLCERCLEPFILNLQEKFALCLVVTEQAAKTLPERYEPWVAAKGEMLSLIDMVTEELLLALPIVPKHADPHCFKHLNNLQSRQDHEPAQPNRIKGLEILKS